MTTEISNTIEQTAPATTEPKAKAKARKAKARKAKAPAASKTIARFPEANELVLELIREHGPCQVGKVRAEWATKSKKFAELTDRQRKGVIRRAVRKLEAEGKVTKTGHIFAVAKRNGNGKRKPSEPVAA
jgi:hypothetical protein